MSVVSDRRGWRMNGGRRILPAERCGAGSGRRARAARVAWLVGALLASGCAGEPRGACDPNPVAGAVGSICGFRNPEDVEVVPASGLLLVSEMRRGSQGGSLAAIPLDTAAQLSAPRRLWPSGDPARDLAAGVGDPSCTERPSENAFSPHGITAVPAPMPGVVRVAVVGHGEREAVEFFDLIGTGTAATLSWRGCVPLPPQTVANDVSLGADGEVVVSNYMPAMAGWRGLFHTIASGLGRKTGDVMAWRRETGWRHLRGTEAPAPNGVLVSSDGKEVFYAETGSGLVRRVPRGGAGDGVEGRHAAIGGNPDNLSSSPRGTVLAVTHTDGAGFLFCVLGRLPCRTGWSLVEIDPTDLKADLLLHHDGTVVGAVASAAEFQGRVYFGAVFDDRIGVWQRGTAAQPVE